MESGSLDGEVPQGSWRDRPRREEGFVEEVVPDLRCFQLKLTLLHCACRSISRAWKVRFSSWRSLWLLCTPVGLAASWATAADCETTKRREALALGPLVSGNFGKFGHLSFTCSLYQVSKSWCFFLIINSYFCLISSRTLIRSSPGVVSTFTLTLKSFGTRCSSTSCLTTERKNESVLTIRRPEVCWWAAVHRSFKNSAYVFATPPSAWFGFSVIICWWQNIYMGKKAYF